MNAPRAVTTKIAVVRSFAAACSGGSVMERTLASCVLSCN